MKAEGSSSLEGGVGELPYINLHLLVDTVIHDQAMGQPDAMRLHWVASDVCIISNVGVVEVRNSLLAAWAVQRRGINGCERRHFENLEVVTRGNEVCKEGLRSWNPTRGFYVSGTHINGVLEKLALMSKT
jgi:hypothetical protein